jgi:hypothetical protein
MTDYITSSQLKATLEIANTDTYADADIAVAISSASRVIDAYKGTRFFPTTETRQYTYRYTDDCTDLSLPIYDANASTAVIVAVDVAGDGSYGSTWVQGTDYYLEPKNADLTGRPYNRVTIRRQSGRVWPRWQYGVQVTASFGWATAPAQVTEACSILAGRYLQRARDTPYGIVSIGTDALAAARLGKIDPDVAFMLDNLTDNDVPTLIL